MAPPKFEIVVTTTGVVSIKNCEVNEIMHNPVGPWIEANLLYVKQAEFEKKIQQNPMREFVLFDVGLGAAANALAVLHSYQKVKNNCQVSPLRLVSFEIDLSLLGFALENANQFEHFAGYEEIIHALLEERKWKSPCGSIQWELRVGDFLKLIDGETSSPDLIFYDPYSPKVNKEMWTIECFKGLRRCCRQSELYTYSQATSIRAAMMLGGFYVGQGIATGMKDKTTVASTQVEQLKMPLDERWFLRWIRSDRRYPHGVDKSHYSQVMREMLAHPQFKLFCSAETCALLESEIEAKNE